VLWVRCRRQLRRHRHRRQLRPARQAGQQPARHHRHHQRQLHRGWHATCARSTTCASIFDTRWKNAIAYVSPTFAGLNATVAYVANENKTFNGRLPPANTTGYDVV
jgi:hypothetical protein